MEHQKRLFSIDNENIRVTINLGFDGEDLKLDGYDIGKTVIEMWGDSEEFTLRVSQNPLAVKVKINDLTDNMDIKRIPQLTEKDLTRLMKYHKAYRYLISLY